jgi:signal transduction histidine kinase
MDEGERVEKTIAGLPIDSPAMFLVAAHELKSPLALIRQLSLSLESGDLTSGEYAKLTHQITLTSERALRLTGDITRSSVVGEKLFDLEALNPISLCEEVAHELSPLYSAHDRVIRVSKRTNAPLVVANRDLLRRVLLNFGDNALHYADTTQPVELQVRSIGDQVRVGVRDFGPAVSADAWRALQHRLLEQAPQPLHARPQSSGLGLSIAQQFAGFMNGSVGATRHRDGATFYIDIHSSTQLSLL